MDMFLQNQIVSLQKARIDYIYDGWMHFFGLHKQGTIHSHYKSWEAPRYFLMEI